VNSYCLNARPQREDAMQIGIDLLAPALTCLLIAAPVRASAPRGADKSRNEVAGNGHYEGDDV